MQASVPIAVVLAAVLAGAFFLPVQPLYASSDSMAPALEQGDLYFVLEGGAVHTGDVIAFESARFGGLATHRVVGEKPEGYVTKGDANPSTDQEAGHPIVSRSAVVGTVVTVNGRPVTVAAAGPFAARLAANSLVRWGLGALLAIVVGSWAFGGSARSVPTRDVVLLDDVLVPLFVGSLLLGLLFVYWGGSTLELNYVASQGAVTAVHTVPVGETVRRTVTVNTFSLPFTTVIVEANGVDVVERTATAGGLELLVRVPAQASTGVYRASVDVATYPATLPRGAIEWLHGVHWVAGAGGTLAPVFAPVLLVYLAFVDGRMPIRWPKSRWLRRVGGI